MPLAILALALGAFAIGSTEFVISGILPPLAADLRVSIPTAGLLVSAYAIGVAVGGPILTIFAARLPPKRVLVGSIVVFTVAQLLCAIAPDYTLLLLARLLAAAMHGVFFGAGNVLVASLVPLERRGRAFSLFIGGITVANLLGLPGGTAIGNAFGWRMSFVAVAAIGLAATLAMLARVPSVSAPPHGETGIVPQLRALRHYQVWLSYVTIALTMVAALSFTTYFVPFATEIAGMPLDIVPFVFLLGGIGSIIGIWLGGRATDWRPMPALVATLLAQAALFAIMVAVAELPVAVAVTYFLAGIAGFAFSTPLQARIIHAAREAPNLASALVSTAFNIGIAGGAFVGAMWLSSGGSYRLLPVIGIVCALLAAATAALGWRLDRRNVAVS